MFISKKDLIKFISDRLKNPDFEGCYYTYLGENLYLVFSKDYNGNDDLDCKVAFNCDDLQCDYDYDWEEPSNVEGEHIGQEWYDVLECGYTAEQLAEEVEASYNYVIGCGWTLDDNEEDDEHYAELI